MDFNLIEILKLIGALGFFIFGMKVMTEAIQKLAGKRLREILQGMTKNRLLSVMTGLFVTGIIQSSSASTVIVVSFANAGLITLTESIGVIIGANLGTTVTTWIISLFGFQLDISSFALPLIAVASPLLFFKSSFSRSLAEVFIGFALLFLGLDAIKDSIPNINENPELIEFISQFSDYGTLSTLTFIIIGATLTALVQSSSVAMVLTLTLLYKDVISFDMAAAMVLGENIGTTITANLAALVANAHGKRAAFSHFLINLIGVLWALIIFPYFMDFLDWIYSSIDHLQGKSNSTLTGSSEEIKLALFHSVFNLLNAILFIGVIPVLARFVCRVFPTKPGESSEYSLEYIRGTLFDTAEFSLLECRKELMACSKRVHHMFTLVSDLLFSTEKAQHRKLLDELELIENEIDQYESRIAIFLEEISKGEISRKTSVEIRKMFSIVLDLERLSDIYYQIAQNLNKKKKKKVWFTPEQRSNLLDMIGLLSDASEIMLGNVTVDARFVELISAEERESDLNKLTKKLRKEHIKFTEKGKYSVESGHFYNTALTLFERAGDHILKISQTIVSTSDDLHY